MPILYIFYGTADEESACQIDDSDCEVLKLEFRPGALNPTKPTRDRRDAEVTLT